MHLDPKACENYYCAQVQTGGGPYFQGVGHQRGYGMFSNLFRFITPIAMKAGKYLGKHLLSAGSKIYFRCYARTKICSRINLNSWSFYKDRASKHDSVELANVGDNSNPGYQTRYNICKNSKLIDMIGPLHFDLGNQSKCLINSVNLRIKLERNKDAFALMSPTKDFKILIQHASLFVRKVKVAPPVLIAHEVA
ncbi:uncharacterized protein TNCV_270431 [Trichonephila clavipes]|nr:uncharacterized protein TNCV_270431 [Trichonephila clavipes]